MIVLEEDSMFSIWREYTLSETDRDVLIRLYAPLIGSSGLGLYEALDSLANNTNRYEWLFNTELAMMVGLSLTQLDQTRKYLEATNLLETKRKETKTGVKYIYKLLPPASPKKFFADSNIILKGLLLKAMGEKYMVKAKTHFAIGSAIDSDFSDISATTNDLFTIDLNEPYYTLSGKNEVFTDKQYKSIEADFDEKEFKRLSKESQIALEVVEKALPEVKRVACIYGVKIEKCHELFVRSISSENVFSPETFKELAMKTVKYGAQHKKGTSYAANGNSLNAFIARNFENMSPADYLAKCTKATPLKTELELIDQISSQFGFDSGVINAIIDYTLKKCENKLPEKFVLKVASTLKRSDVVTAFDAMSILYRNEKKSKKASIDKESFTPVGHSEEVHDEASTPDISTLDLLIGDEL